MAGTVTNITGLVTGSELDIVNVKVLKNLRHNTLGLMMSATPDNPQVVAGGGTAVFKIQKYLQSKQYTKANRNDEGDLVAQEVKVKADIVEAISFKYEIETLELAGLSFENRNAYVSYIADGISVSMTALMDALMIDLAVETAKANKAELEVINAKFLLGTEMTSAERETAYLQVADAKIDVARGLTRYNLGSNEAKYATFLMKKLTNRLLLAMPKGGDSATQIGKDLSGVDGVVNIAGLGAVKDHLFLGKDIPAGTAFSADKSFDFSQVAGATIHGEALFLATQGLLTTGAVDPDSGNQKYVTKFNYFSKAVRGDLIRVYRTVASA